MNPTSSNGYLLLFRGTNWHRELPTEEVGKIMSEWNQWFDRLSQEGKIIAASPLENEGKIVSGKSGSVADGPFAESKEAIGGFFLLNVPGMGEALEIAKQCPALPQGLTVEVRPVAPICPAGKMAGEAKVHSLA
jgi:hypothetical protein